MTLGRDTLIDLWTRMVRIRRFEDRVATVAANNEADGFLHTYSGQEAVACGVIPLLREDDWFTSTYRNHGHAIARNISLEGIAGEVYGKANGVCRGKGGSMHVADQDNGMIGGMGIVAGGLPIATGAAYAYRYLGRDSVSVAFFGDGAVHQGAWHESLDFAALFECPVIFVCENNLYAESTYIEYHLNAESVAAMAAPYGIPAVQVDGMDVLAVRDAMEEAISRGRSGGGPSLIEAMTYRYGGQYEGDNQLYKPAKEEAWWREQDPLLRFRATVEGLIDSAELDAIDEQAAADVAAAFDVAIAAPWPDVSELTTDVYAPIA
jgi:TPP-dependent pyruvate/acetoin dehydrogenase alpha subunit